MKNDCRTCPFCDHNNRFEDSLESKQIPCNVRCFKNELFTLWRCNNCKSLHCLEAADLPKFYADYPFKDHKLNFHMRTAYAKRMKLLLQAGVGKDSQILDYGCGAGLYVDYLRDKGFLHVQGYDPYIERFSDPRILDQQYDVVVSHDVIEHVDDPRGYFEQLSKLVRAGGQLVVGTPNATELGLQYEGAAPPELSVPYHRHIFSEQALAKLAEAFGLKVESTYRRFYFDTLIPTVNTRFMWSYIDQKGGFIDSAVEKPDLGFILSNPKLLLQAFFGFFNRMPGNMLMTLRKSAVVWMSRPAERSGGIAA